MAGGLIIAIIIPLLAFVGLCEWLIAAQENRRLRELYRRRLGLDDQPDPMQATHGEASLYRQPPGPPCVWPRLEPEVEQLRQRAKL